MSIVDTEQDRKCHREPNPAHLNKFFVSRPCSHQGQFQQKMGNLASRLSWFRPWARAAKMREDTRSHAKAKNRVGNPETTALILQAMSNNRARCIAGGCSKLVNFVKQLQLLWLK